MATESKVTYSFFFIFVFGLDENGQIMRNDESVGGGEPLPKLMVHSNCWSTILLSAALSSKPLNLKKTLVSTDPQNLSKLNNETFKSGRRKKTNEIVVDTLDRS